MQHPERPRLHYLYYLLAGFDVLTVTLSLVLILVITARYTRSVDQNRIWADRLGRCWDLSGRAAEVAAPANDVFDTERDVAVEFERFQKASARLEISLAGIRDALPVMEAEKPGLGVIFAAIVTARDEMVDEAEAIFADFQSQRTTNAGTRMAAMDRAYYRMNDALARLAGEVRSVQLGYLEAQEAAGRSLRVYEFIIAGLIVVMVAGVTSYGTRLSRQMKDSAEELDRYRDHLETLVEARTAQLATSHAKLRETERLASIGTLAAGLGHDMNNVLFPVQCRLDALEATELADQAREEIGAVRRSIRYLQQLSDGLRLLALDPDDPDAAAGVTDVSEWWEQVLPLVRTALPRQATLETDWPDDLPSIAVAAHALTQAVFNLVVNAGEILDERGRVTIRIRPIDDGRAVRLQVEDDGPGMTAEVKSRALEPFFTTKTRGLSTGLGLALVHGVAHAAGGRVEIESEPGRGTCVTMTLPAVDPVRQAPAQGPRRLAAVSLRDARIKSVVSALLGAAGFDVVAADGDPGAADLWFTGPGEEALARARAFIEDDRRRRVVVYGAASHRPAWHDVAEFVESGGGFAEIRHAIRAATEPAPEGPPS